MLQSVLRQAHQAPRTPGPGPQPYAHLRSHLRRSLAYSLLQPLLQSLPQSLDPPGPTCAGVLPTSAATSAAAAITSLSGPVWPRGE